MKHKSVARNFELSNDIERAWDQLSSMIAYIREDDEFALIAEAALRILLALRRAKQLRIASVRYECCADTAPSGRRKSELAHGDREISFRQDTHPIFWKATVGKSAIHRVVKTPPSTASRKEVLDIVSGQVAEPRDVAEGD
jgi:hypothetical protein